MVLKTSRREKGLSVHNRRRGAVKMDYIFGGALGAVILGAMVLAVVYGLGSRRPDKANIDYHYKCDKCGEEFVTKEAPVVPKNDPRSIAPKPIDCPKCGAKASAYVMAECPKCHKYFVLPSTKNPAAVMMGQIKDLCPNCGLDYREWQSEETKKARRERIGG